MLSKILIIIACLCVCVSAVSQNKEVILHKTTEIKSTDIGTYQKKAVQLTQAIVRESHSYGISTRVRKVIKDIDSEKTVSKNSMTRVAVPLSLMTANEYSTINNSTQRGILRDKNNNVSTKSRVTVPPLTAKKIENQRK
jgi:hypothetical protein